MNYRWQPPSAGLIAAGRKDGAKTCLMLGRGRFVKLRVDTKPVHHQQRCAGALAELEIRWFEIGHMCDGRQWMP